MHRSILPFGSLVTVAGVLTTMIVACGSDSTNTPPGIDASAPGIDASPGDGGDGPKDAAADNTVPSDAGTDADAATNNSVWTAASGLLPENACAPWTLTDTADPEQPVIGAGKLTVATSTDTENMYYSQSAAFVPAQLVIEARVRLVSGTGSTPSRGPAFVGFRYGPEKRKNGLYLTTTEAFILTAESTKGAAAAVATTDAMHTYKIVVNTATHALEVFRDGASILTGSAFVEPDPNAQPDIAWGEGSLFGTGTSEWESVTHNAHVLGPCP